MFFVLAGLGLSFAAHLDLVTLLTDLLCALYTRKPPELIFASAIQLCVSSYHQNAFKLVNPSFLRKSAAVFAC